MGIWIQRLVLTGVCWSACGLAQNMSSPNMSGPNMSLPTITQASGAAVTSPTAGTVATVVTISPGTAAVHLGTFFQFSAKVTGNTNTNVAWTVALPAGATGSPGTIGTSGRYTPPAAMPSVNSVIVTVASVAVPAVTASATVTLDNFFPTVSSTVPAAVTPGAAFTLNVNGSGFVTGAVVQLGGAALATTFVSATRLTATGTTTAAQKGQRLAVIVTNPNPGSAASVDVVSVLVGAEAAPVISAQVASRFLEQAAFGPDAPTLAHVQATGLKNYLTEQLSAPVSPYPDPSQTGFGIGQMQARFFSNAVHGQDQLRQRVAFALSQIFVVSASEENTAAQLVPYHQILQKDAFANFRTLMNDVTLSPTMGEYLDMRNNDKASPTLGTRANENYARELLQLFTIGLFELNADGTLKLDASKNPIPTYDQTAIQNFAKVYTGWTYPTKPGATPQKHNPTYFGGQMAAFEANHDMTAKTLLNYATPTGVLVNLPAGQTAALDLKDALDNIFYHPNVAPFIGKQLIQRLVTSNPSPAYVARIAAVFNNNGHGVRGDLAAVVSAILLDAEARKGDSGPSFNPPDNSGHLREPVFVVASILRGLGAQVNDTNNLTNLAGSLGQTVFTPPTVFNYDAPGYMIPAEFTPGQSLLGPEFQLFSPSSAVARFNAVNSVIYGNLGAGAVIDLTPYINLGSNPSGLMTAINNTFFDGQMPATMQTDILAAVNAVTGSTTAVQKARAQAALYLALSSSYYNVEH